MVKDDRVCEMVHFDVCKYARMLTKRAVCNVPRVRHEYLQPASSIICVILSPLLACKVSPFYLLSTLALRKLTLFLVRWGLATESFDPLLAMSQDMDLLSVHSTVFRRTVLFSRASVRQLFSLYVLKTQVEGTSVQKMTN